MTTQRNDTRRDYRHFPPEYAKLLRNFERDGRADIGPMSEREARASARDLYRWKMFLSAACDADADDPYARELLDIFTSVTLRVEAAANAAEGDDRTHVVVFSLNPIVAHVRRTASAGFARPPSTEPENDQ